MRAIEKWNYNDSTMNQYQVERNRCASLLEYLLTREFINTLQLSGFGPKHLSASSQAPAMRTESFDQMSKSSDA